MDITKDDLSDIIINSLKFKKIETLSTDDFENTFEYSITFKSLKVRYNNSDRLFGKIKDSIEKIINEFKK